MINIHTGDSTKIRGLEAPFWTRFHNLSSYTTTMHVIDEGIDTGDIIKQISSPFEDFSTTIYPVQIAQQISDMIVSHIKQYCLGDKSNIKYTKNDIKTTTYHTLPNNQDIKTMKEKGVNFIDTKVLKTHLLNQYTNQKLALRQYEELKCNLKICLNT